MCASAQLTHVACSRKFIRSSNVTIELACLYQVMNKVGPPPSQTRLVYGGQDMADGHTMGAYGIHQDATVHRVIKLWQATVTQLLELTLLLLF